jgi:phage terminase small subunit
MSKRPKEPKELNDQQKLFCLEYVKDLNGKQAAIRAKYSEKTAESQASRLLRHAKVRLYCQDLLNRRTERLESQADNILIELRRLGYSDIRSIYGDNGEIKPPSEWSEEIGRAVASIEVKEEFEDHRDGVVCNECGRLMFRALVGFTKKVKFWDKPKSLELMGKHEKLFTEKVEHSLDTKLEDLIAGNTPKKEEPHG